MTDQPETGDSVVAGWASRPAGDEPTPLSDALTAVEALSCATNRSSNARQIFTDIAHQIVRLTVEKEQARREMVDAHKAYTKAEKNLVYLIKHAVYDAAATTPRATVTPNSKEPHEEGS